MTLRSATLIAVATLASMPAYAVAAKSVAHGTRKGAMSYTATLEAAPLRSLVGELDLRAELALPWRLALGTRLENADGPSERAHFRDHRQAFAAETLWYPLSSPARAAFVALGARRETSLTGRQAPADTNTWARTNSDELDDRWSSTESCWASTQAIGVRMFFGGFGTVSLRLERDEVLTRDTKIHADQVKSYDPDLTTVGRPVVRAGLTLHAGVFLP